MIHYFGDIPNSVARSRGTWQLSQQPLNPSHKAFAPAPAGLSGGLKFGRRNAFLGLYILQFATNA
jgi:hypothetical protein